MPRNVSAHNPLSTFQTLPGGDRIEIAKGTACPYCEALIRCSDARTSDRLGLQIICAHGHTFLAYEPRQ
jgi:hypothetical protein